MTKDELKAYNKRCRAPFTDVWGNSTKPKHPVHTDIRSCEQLAEITANIPEVHRQGFIRLQNKIFGLKIVKTDSDKRDIP